MIQCRDKQQKKDACEAFKLLLQYMGDRKTKQKDVNLIALDITSQAWEKKGLRDELYIQLCRQTSSNSSPYVFTDPVIPELYKILFVVPHRRTWLSSAGWLSSAHLLAVKKPFCKGAYEIYL